MNKTFCQVFTYQILPFCSFFLPWSSKAHCPACFRWFPASVNQIFNWWLINRLCWPANQLNRGPHLSTVLNHRSAYFVPKDNFTHNVVFTISYLRVQISTSLILLCLLSSVCFFSKLTQKCYREVWIKLAAKALSLIYKWPNARHV